MLFPKGAESSFLEYVAPQLTGFNAQTGYYLSDTPLGTVLKYEAPVIESPADSISIAEESIEIAISESKTVSALLPEGSDDRVIWKVTSLPSEDGNEVSDAVKYLKLAANGTDVVITGRRNGTVLLVATVYSSASLSEPVSASCVVKIGTGGSGADAVIWQNGTKDTKTCTIKTGLSASSWTDSKNKTKKGKLVWFVSDVASEPVFDSSKHTVSFTVARSKLVSVNNKGVVTAKKAGTVYVYVCDTGSLEFEEYVIDIAAGPTKLFLTSIPNSTAKDTVLKKVGLNAGSSGRVYITPFIKDGAVDAECTYSVELADTAKLKYASLEDVATDSDGNAYFVVNALDVDQTKAKTVSVKIVVKCVQTGKKANMTVVIGNPVLQVTAVCESLTKPVLVSKKDTVSLKLSFMTPIGEASMRRLRKVFCSSSFKCSSRSRLIRALKVFTISSVSF